MSIPLNLCWLIIRLMTQQLNKDIYYPYYKAKRPISDGAFMFET